MFFTYTPDDGDEQQWEFVPSEVLADEGEAAEKAYGQAWDLFLVDVFKGSMRARRTLLWMLMRREHPSLSYVDTPNFKAGEVLVELDRAELQEMRDRLAATPDPDADVLAHLDSELLTAPEAGLSGKARLNRKERRTGSRSPASSTSVRKSRKR